MEMTPARLIWSMKVMEATDERKLMEQAQIAVLSATGKMM